LSSQSKKKYITIKEWIPKYENPIVLKKGDKVRLGREDDEWKGWIWCISKDNSGWVPKQIIKQIDNSRGEILEDYEAIELNASVNEIISELKDLNGWIWGLNENTNLIGWLPKEILIEIINNK